MNRPPAFQFYVKDWLTSRKIAVMDLAQVGAYSFLLAACWDSDDCSLPDDDKTLSILSRMGEQWCTDASAPVRACFIPHPKHPGHLTNERLLAEFKSLQKFRRDKQRAGQIGGVKSGLSRRQISVKDTEADLKHTFDFASSKTQAKRSSSSSSSSSELKKEKSAHPAAPVYLNGSQAGFQRFWTAFPKKRNKGDAEKAWLKLKPDDVLLDTMLSKIEQAAHTPDWKKENGKYIPYPASWLNAKGWEDEYAVSPQRTGGLVL
jgi:uncharacterized protein YdaU (DUF1376 family)